MSIPISAPALEVAGYACDENTCTVVQFPADPADRPEPGGWALRLLI